MNLSQHFYFLAATTCLVFANVGAAQTPPDPNARGPKNIAIDFPGGTLGQYVTMLQESGGKVNVAMSNTTACDVPLPPMHLGAVTATAAVRLLENSYDLDPNNSVHIRVNEVGLEGSGPDAIPIYRIFAERTMVKVWNVLDLFGDEVSPSDVLTAIENAVKVLSEESRDPTILFHESTGVLIMRGTPRHVETIDRLIEELRGQLVLKGIFAGWDQLGTEASGPAMLADFQSQVNELRKRFKALEDRCGVTTQ